MKRMKNHKNVKNGVATLALCLTVGTMYMINPVTVGAANKRPVDVTKSPVPRKPWRHHILALVGEIFPKR